jgi:hypothetical protein
MTDTPPDGNEPPAEPEVDPEQIGADLFRRLDILDDRLQRSQEKMLSLIDQKLNGLQGTGAPGESAPAPAAQAPAAQTATAQTQAESAPTPPAGLPATLEGAPPATPDEPAPGSAGPDSPSAQAPAAGAEAGPAVNGVAFAPPAPPAPGSPKVGDQGSMDAWFGGAPATSLARVAPPATPQAPSGSGQQAVGTTGGAVSSDAGLQHWPAPPAGAEVASIVPLHRPAWQSNLIAALITALVVVVGLFLVGLF